MSDVDTEEFVMRCYDCERRVGRRALEFRDVVYHPDPDAWDYEFITVPLCRECIGHRYGWDCPNCGCTYTDRDDAEWCCRRRPGEAPDCIECGRRMKRGAWGYASNTGPTVEWAECEGCGIGWGRFTGWHYPDGWHQEADTDA